MHTVCCVEPGMVIDSAGGTAFIPAGAITNAMLANMPANTVKVNATGAPAAPQDLLINEANLLGRETGNDLAALTAAQARGVIDFNVQVPIAYGLVTEEPTGFPLDFTTGEVDRQSSVLDFIDGTRTFSIQPTGVDFTFYQVGVEYTSTGDTVVISNTVGLHYIYYNLGTLYSTTVFNIDVIYSLVLVAVVYWTGLSSIYLGEERHGLKMDGTTHAWMHQSRGTLYLSGLALANFAYSGGAVDASAQFSVDGGTIKDEDIFLTLLTPGASTVGLPVLYKTGAGVWNMDAPTGFSIKNTGSGRAAWNEFTGGVWQQTESATNTYVLAHVFAINIDADTYAGANYYHLVAIQGEANYSNKNDAVEGAATEINDLVAAGLPFSEFVPVASVIYNTRDAYSNAVKSIIEQPEAGVDYVDWRFSRVSPTTTPGSHNNLSDRDAPGSHPGLAIDDVLLLDGSRPMLGDLDMNNFCIINTEYVDFEIVPTAVTPQEGRLWWSNTDHTMNMGTETIAVIQVAQEQVIRARNNTGSTLLDGKPVTVTGAIGSRPTIALGQADTLANSQIVGMTTHDILNNTEGYVTSVGLVRDVDTSSWSDGAILWLDASVAGDLTITRPDAPNTSVFVAQVLYAHATQGIFSVSPVVLPRLSWLSDVNIRGTESDQDMIWWDVANLRWDNVAASSSPGASQAVVVTDANGSVAFDTSVLVVDATTDGVGIANAAPANQFNVNTPASADATADAILTASATTQTPLVVQGVALQAVNLQEWQDSTGAITFATGDGLAGSEFIFNEQGLDINFRVKAFGVSDALIIQGSDGQATIGALGTGFVRSDAGGILSSSALIVGDLPVHASSHEIAGGDLVDHDNLTNFVANKHIDHTAVTLTLGSGLAGTGDISANRTFDLDINSLAVAAIVASDFVPFWDITVVATNKKITFANFEAALTHDNLIAGTIADHDTTATGANLTAMTDNSMVDALHRHSELSASDGTPDQALVVDATGDVGLGIAIPSSALHIKHTTNSGGIRLEVDTGVANNRLVMLNGDMTVGKGSMILNVASAVDGLLIQAGNDTGAFVRNVAIFLNDGSTGLNGIVAPASALDIGAGALTIAEMSAPSGVASNVKIYAVDNGGKTELRAIFQTGASQLIATEP